MSQQQQKRTEAEEAYLAERYERNKALIIVVAIVAGLVLTSTGLTPFSVSVPGNWKVHIMSFLGAFGGTTGVVGGIGVGIYTLYCQLTGQLPHHAKTSVTSVNSYSDTDLGHPNNIPSVNPDTGKPLTHGGSGLDTGGNTYGSGS